MLDRLSLACLLTLAICPTGSAQGTLSPYVITDGSRIEQSLTGLAGDWTRGRTLYFDRQLTGCSACHGSPAGPGAEIVDENADAPSLTAVGSHLEIGEIRLWIVAPQAINPETAMPGFFLAGQRPEADSPVINGPWLTAQQIEDLVAYLARQTEVPE